MRINNKIQFFIVLCLLPFTTILGRKDIQAQCNADFAVEATITIVEPLELNFDSIVVTSLLCYGDCTAEITAYVSGGTPPYTYTLLPLGVTNMSGVFTNLCAGVYIIMVEDMDGAPPIFSDPVIIGNPPEIQIDSLVIEHIGCNNQGIGAIYLYGDGGTGTLTYTLNPGGIVNATGIFTGLAAGTYSVIIEDDNGCSDDTTIAVEAYPDPIANFSDSSQCNYDIYFTDLSIPNAASLVAWAWDFGDGSGSSTLQNPIYTYAGANTYNVTLIVTNDHGCKDTVILPVVVTDMPIADFTADTACEGTPTQFTDLSIPGHSPLISWVWDFGDGGTSTIQNPTHIYTSHGVYMVTMMIGSDCGCMDSIAKEVLVEDNASVTVNSSKDPLLNIYPNPFKEGISISFNLADQKRVNIAVINTSGKIIANITNEQYPAGEHQLRWNSKGHKPGVYILRMTVGYNVYTSKIVKNP
jgi:PKD repeat protein